jgi:hypothetical protein
MKTRRKSIWASIGLALLGGFVIEPLFARDAHAIIGRPLTPMSYAGVARRTTRRAVYAGAAYGAVARPYPYAVPPPAPYYW